MSVHIRKREFVGSTLVEYTTPEGVKIIKGKYSLPPRDYDPYNGWKAKLIQTKAQKL